LLRPDDRLAPPTRPKWRRLAVQSSVSCSQLEVVVSPPHVSTTQLNSTVQLSRVESVDLDGPLHAHSVNAVSHRLPSLNTASVAKQRFDIKRLFLGYRYFDIFHGSDSTESLRNTGWVEGRGNKTHGPGRKNFGPFSALIGTRLCGTAMACGNSTQQFLPRTAKALKKMWFPLHVRA
jgi:hypothetical protein